AAVVINAITDYWPAVVFALSDDIYFITAFGPMLLLPQLTLSIKRKAFGVAQTQGPYFRLHSAPPDKWIVRRNRAVRFNADNFAKRVREILRGRSGHVRVIAERCEQLPIASLRDAASMGVIARPILVEDDLHCVEPWVITIDKLRADNFCIAVGDPAKTK